VQLDAIKEIGNIGTGNAATALSKLLGRVVEMDVPKVELVSIYELSEYYGSSTTPVASVFVRSEGKLSCSIIFIDSESFLGAINSLIETTFQISVPGVAHDMLGSILDVVASIFGTYGGVRSCSQHYTTYKRRGKRQYGWQHNLIA